MIRRQIEKFAVGYPFPTDLVADLLRKYNFDKNKVHEILCKSKESVISEVQNIYTKNMKVIDEHICK